MAFAAAQLALVSAAQHALVPAAQPRLLLKRLLSDAAAAAAEAEAEPLVACPACRAGQGVPA